MITARIPPRLRSARGSGLLELMISSVILIVAMTGFVAAMRDAVNATAVAHRRTESTLLRTGLIERLSVSRRSAIATLAGRGWLVDSCYDVDARPLGDNSAAWDPAFACPGGTVYRRMVSATAVPDATGAEQRIWTVSV